MKKNKIYIKSVIEINIIGNTLGYFLSNIDKFIQIDI